MIAPSLLFFIPKSCNVFKVVSHKHFDIQKNALISESNVSSYQIFNIRLNVCFQIFIQSFQISKLQFREFAYDNSKFALLIAVIGLTTLFYDNLG